jgi:hypothetical protein
MAISSRKNILKKNELGLEAWLKWYSTSSPSMANKKGGKRKK